MSLMRFGYRIGWIALLMILTGCSGTGKVDVSKLDPPPSTLELAQAHNERVASLPSLWARISLRAKGTYADGESYEEQGEGHLQLVKPNNISLTIGKLGETYFAFGANADQYWSFDLSNSDHKTVLVGQLDQATPEKASALGLPVHPAELIALTGLMPIDLANAGGTRWADDAKSVGISMPSRWGSVTLWFNPRTSLVVRSQAYNQSGNLVATASLSRYKEASIKGHSPIMVPGKIEITTPTTPNDNDTGFIRIELSEPRSKAIRPIVFDPSKLIRSYRVDETIDLDAAFENAPETSESGDAP
jgi:hypothetical protein